MNSIIIQLKNALETMLIATDDSVELPPEHPGHEAYLKTVAIPRAKDALSSFRLWEYNNFSRKIIPIDKIFEKLSLIGMNESDGKKRKLIEKAYDIIKDSFNKNFYNHGGIYG